MSVFERGKRNDELAQELEEHVRMAVRDRVARGEDPVAAEAAARREFGNVGLIQEVTREGWGGGGIVRLLQDLRFGLRLLRRNGVFTAISMLTLALGIGATTAIFSVVYGVLLRPLPYAHPDQIVSVAETQVAHPELQSDFADPNFLDLRTQNRTLNGLAEYQSDVVTVAVPGGEPERLEIGVVSRDFFTVLGAHPLVGREFAPEDQRPGAGRVALISDSYWRHAFGGRPDLGAFRLRVGNDSYAVVGVMPPGFAFPDASSLWLPRETDAPGTSRTAHNWKVAGRLRGGVRLASAQSELSALSSRLKTTYGKDVWMDNVTVQSLRSALTGRVRSPLLLLLSAVSFLLLIACANVVNLQLAQATSRESELAVRTALGAAPSRLRRQFLVESLLLSLTGGLLGVLAAVWGVRLLIASAPNDLPRLGDVGVNIPVLLFALLVAAAVGAGLALVTAHRAASVDPRSGLMSGGRGFSGGQSAQRLGRTIVAVQIALTLVLLVGAGLLGRSLLSVLAVDPGFRTDNIVTMSMALPENLPGDRGVQARVAFLDELQTRLRRIPGVTEVGGTNQLPLAGRLTNGTFLMLQPGAKAPPMANLEKLFQDPSRTGQADYSVATSDYLRTLGVPLLRGRLFEDRDTRNAPHVALINAALVRERWPNQDPLGATLEFGNMDGDLEPITVIGVVGDMRSRDLETSPRPTIYVNYRQRPTKTFAFTVVLHTTAPTGSVAAAARQVLRELDPTVPPSFESFRQVFSESVATRRFTLILVTLFAATAMLLAVAGVYGVMGYSVARRTREMGVRMALGAQSSDVVGLIVGQGLAATGVGLLVGLIGSLILMRSLKSLLYTVSEWDPTTFVGVALILAFFGFAASYIPARRATRVDPQSALRAE